MNLIEDPLPIEWKDLQAGVCRILREIGLDANEGVLIETPRGKVELDVLAVDKNSVDMIKYIVECKNWNSPIPQTVVHAFITVMNEVGGNIGYLVSKSGLQEGAIDYAQHTNIVGMTYAEFQDKYFNAWWKKWFVPRIGDLVDALTQYVEPINSFRDKRIAELTPLKQREFADLVRRYQMFGIFMAFFEFPRYTRQGDFPTPMSIERLKAEFVEKLGDEFSFSSVYYRDLHAELLGKLQQVTDQFHGVFGKNIFA